MKMKKTEWDEQIILKELTLVCDRAIKVAEEEIEKERQRVKNIFDNPPAKYPIWLSGYLAGLEWSLEK